MDDRAGTSEQIRVCVHVCACVGNSTVFEPQFSLTANGKVTMQTLDDPRHPTAPHPVAVNTSMLQLTCVFCVCTCVYLCDSFSQSVRDLVLRYGGIRALSQIVEPGMSTKFEVSNPLFW